ncbi:hypothetical protein ZIOFF_015710 [Zingiber officinale]|uniref:Glycosyltransferases n=1 Tax=Zingiber officinale TaxID=94328 RepID=A0A8J5HEL9_ZINOF|nr:hypothetical protein ZIOFF_015710 [Zingiber officinale]
MSEEDATFKTPGKSNRNPRPWPPASGRSTPTGRRSRVLREVGLASASVASVPLISAFLSSRTDSWLQMASIRRTFLAATDLDRSCRHHALLHRKGSLSSSFSSRGKLQQHHNSWRRWCLLRLLLFFLFGFLFGLFPFADLEDSSFRPRRLSFGSSSSAILTTATDNSGNSYLPRRALGNVALRYRASQIDGARFIKDASNPPPFKLPQDQSGDGKLLLIVTPTYSPAFQRLYLSRLGQTLRLVRPPLLWIVVEMNEATVETADILRGTGVMYRHLVCKKNLTDTMNRGVHQRNTALEHIERHRLDGIVHFTDEDSIYSLELFERLREISLDALRIHSGRIHISGPLPIFLIFNHNNQRFGVWPVAMLAQNKNEAILEGPVCNGSQVIGWHTNEKSKRLRRFHVDMSGFAFNSSIIWDTRRWNRPNMDAIQQLDTMNKGLQVILSLVILGQETTFIEQIVEDESQMEGIPYGCSRIMNWHLPLEAKDLVYPKGWQVSRNSDAVVRLT